ncbi:hypothetical protein [Negativicoccus succinicivorans]
MTELYIIERLHVGVDVEALYVFEDREKAIAKYLEVEDGYRGVDKYFINLCRLTILDGRVTAQDYYEFYAQDFEDYPPKNPARTIIEEVNNIFDVQQEKISMILSTCGKLLAENEKLKGKND